jgi:hypothetical protein
MFTAELQGLITERLRVLKTEVEAADGGKEMLHALDKIFKRGTSDIYFGQLPDQKSPDISFGSDDNWPSLVIEFGLVTRASLHKLVEYFADNTDGNIQTVITVHLDY